MSGTPTTVSPSGTKTALVPRITTSAITINNLGTVRKLNSVIFPVKYSDSFYKSIVQPEVEDYCRLIYFNDIPVGTTCSRIEKGSKEGESKLYMMTMGVLAPYRNFSIGTAALDEIILAASTPPPTIDAKHPRITHIYLHVQTSNTDARRFYEKCGFKVVSEVQEYYKRLEPRNAWLLEKEIAPPPPPDQP
ncbi:hypothetical protein BS47DRAFT_1327206 [Hydnum rufescens UP504]|uniref:N-terminal methionine N(alpha)-acetyltransferase NatE n=1 Tax=Hydnum rufescens UP504 TaxID=1448309 RepID=A0A9P6DZ61_9AGAM|nr:hypothetical protein BS47DRAFT_1327206 [Hydnum rufescens UP504]